jgi:separase
VLCADCAGAPAIVANLWDVTDRDIDRFAGSMLQHWSGSHPEVDVESEQQQQHLHVADHQDTCMSYWIAQSRQACRLQALVGDAVACWGLPSL